MEITLQTGLAIGGMVLTCANAAAGFALKRLWGRLDEDTKKLEALCERFKGFQFEVLKEYPTKSEVSKDVQEIGNQIEKILTFHEQMASDRRVVIEGSFSEIRKEMDRIRENFNIVFSRLDQKADK